MFTIDITNGTKSIVLDACKNIEDQKNSRGQTWEESESDPDPDSEVDPSESEPLSESESELVSVEADL